MENRKNNPASVQLPPGIELEKQIATSGPFVPPPPRGYIEVLASKFNCSTRAITMALQGKTCSIQAVKIRKYYMEKYIQPYL